MSGELIIGGGLALLYLLSGKKKKSSSTSSSEDGTHGGSELDDPSKKKEDGKGGGGSGGGGGGKGDGKGGPPPNLAPDAIWVSPNCKTVVFGDGDGEAWWEKKGRPTAQKFVAANYHDPYEISRTMIMSMAPCVLEFPVMEDGYSPMEEEFLREMFRRNFNDVYYLVQFLYNQVAELLDQDTYTIEFTDDCDVDFVGIEWKKPIAERMVRFYLDYMYPIESAKDHDKKYPSWELADPPEKHMMWQDNIATAVLIRMHPQCAIELVNAFKKDPWQAKSFFAKRPGLKTIYDDLTDLVDEVDDNREGGLDFDQLDKLKS